MLRACLWYCVRVLSSRVAFVSPFNSSSRDRDWPKALTAFCFVSRGSIVVSAPATSGHELLHCAFCKKERRWSKESDRDCADEELPSDLSLLSITLPYSRFALLNVYKLCSSLRTTFNAGDTQLLNVNSDPHCRILVSQSWRTGTFENSLSLDNLPENVAPRRFYESTTAGSTTLYLSLS